MLTQSSASPAQVPRRGRPKSHFFHLMADKVENKFIMFYDDSRAHFKGKAFKDRRIEVKVSARESCDGLFFYLLSTVDRPFPCVCVCVRVCVFFSYKFSLRKLSWGRRLESFFATRREETA